MTETHFTWRWLFVVAAFGIVVGIAAGLFFGWVVAPAAPAAVDVASLNAGAQNDYIVLVANSYAYDQEFARARERLALLKDPAISSRVEKLAKALAARQDPSAANVADLAVALGSKDSSLRVLAATLRNGGTVEPTKFAQQEKAPPTETPEPKVEKSPTPTLTPTETLTPVAVAATKKATQIAGKADATNTPRPVPTQKPTSPPQAAAALYPDFRPTIDQWWNAVRFTPANIAPGQTYWRLKSALYCDVKDDRNRCWDLPGGENDHTIYVTLLNEGGGCVEGNVKRVDNTGNDTPFERKDVLYPWVGSCNIDYEWNMYGEGNTVWVDGLPSDKIANLGMQSVKVNWQNNAHVRYFLVFQRTTR